MSAYMGAVHYTPVEPQPAAAPDRRFIIERREETIQGAEKGVYNFFLFPSVGQGDDFFKRIGFSHGTSAVLGLSAVEFFLHGIIGMSEAEVRKRKGLLAQLAQQLSDADLNGGDVSEKTLSKAQLRVLKLAQIVSRGMDIYRQDVAVYRELVGELEASRFSLEMRTSPIDSEKIVYDELVAKLGTSVLTRCDAHRQFHEQSRAFNQKAEGWFWDPDHKVPAELLSVTQRDAPAPLSAPRTATALPAQEYRV